MPLWKHLSQTYNGGAFDTKVKVYAAGGYYSSTGDGALDDGALREEMQSYLDRGFRDVKMKIGGATVGEDARRIANVLDILPPGARLAVDANGRFDLATAVAYGEMLKEVFAGEPAGRLMWYEEAGDPLDYGLQAALSERLPGLPFATGENLFSAVDARNLLRHGGLNREPVKILQRTFVD